MTKYETNDLCADNCPCTDTCPLETPMNLIGGKWKLRIICSLNQDGTTRFNELKRKIPGISNTMLASSLRELETAGLINRRQYDEMPVRVEYSTNESAQSLMPILEQLIRWSGTLTGRTDQSSR